MDRAEKILLTIGAVGGIAATIYYLSQLTKSTTTTTTTPPGTTIPPTASVTTVSLPVSSVYSSPPSPPPQVFYVKNPFPSTVEVVVMNAAPGSPVAYSVPGNSTVSIPYNPYTYGIFYVYNNAIIGGVNNLNLSVGKTYTVSYASNTYFYLKNVSGYDVLVVGPPYSFYVPNNAVVKFYNNVGTFVGVSVYQNDFIQLCSNVELTNPGATLVVSGSGCSWESTTTTTPPTATVTVVVNGKSYQATPSGTTIKVTGTSVSFQVQVNGQPNSTYTLSYTITYYTQRGARLGPSGSVAINTNGSGYGSTTGALTLPYGAVYATYYGRVTGPGLGSGVSFTVELSS